MKISVALCTYNGQKYLQKQLESIIHQSIMVDEIVICDDMSTDGTVHIIETFREQSPVPVKFVKNKVNLGYVKNFEKSICLCSGDIIFLSDQDDIWMSNKVETVCKYFDDHADISFVFTNAVLMNEVHTDSYGKSLFDVVGFDKTNKIKFDSGRVYEVLATSGRVTGATAAFRSSFIPYCIPLPDTKYKSVHDEMIAVTAALYGRLGYIDQCLIKYRLHHGQAVGLNLFFKYPAKSWALSNNLLYWHEKLVSFENEEILQSLRFVYKRFWAIRSRISILKLFSIAISGEYKKFYHDNAAFICDIRSVFIRIINKLRSLHKLQLMVYDSERKSSLN